MTGRTRTRRDTPPTATHQVAGTLLDQLVPITSLRPYPGNARTHDAAVLAESLQANGQYRPVVANSRTNEVLAGNGTLAAALALGWTHLAATWVDADEEQARRIVLVDNRSNDLAGYDDGLLSEILTSTQDLLGTGFDQGALDALLISVRAHERRPALTDPDDAPDAPVVPATRLGDVWLLGGGSARVR